MTTTHSIYDLAEQMDRVAPSHCDKTPAPNGRQQSGHDGHEYDDDDLWPSIGWYCDGGNRGNSVLDIHPGDVAAAYQRLAALPDGALDDIDLDDAFAGLRVQITGYQHL